MVTANVVNSNGNSVIGNRYFSGRNAVDATRAYSRLQPDAVQSSSKVTFGNYPAKDVVQIRNGLEEPKPKTTVELSSDTYQRAQNILERLGYIANEVATNTNLTDADRALYDGEFQELKQRLIADNFGSDPTAAAAANPQNASLQNLELVASDANVLTSGAASTAAASVSAGQASLFQQQNGKATNELEQVSIKREAAYERQKFDKSGEIEELKSNFERQSNPLQRAISRYNPAAITAQRTSGILNLLT